MKAKILMLLFVFGIMNTEAENGGFTTSPIQEQKQSKKKKIKRKKSEDEVVLVVDGVGSDKEEATKQALRSAIEQTYGTFVSSNTSLVNDELTKDEIVTVSSGNIQEYEEVASIQHADGRTTVKLKAVVSISNLTSYAKSKGASVEFAGDVFYMNMKMRELNAQNEEKAIHNLLIQVKELFSNAFDRELIILGEPEEYSRDRDYYRLKMKVILRPTGVVKNINNLIITTLKSLSISDGTKGYSFKYADKYKSYNHDEWAYKEVFLRDRFPVEALTKIFRGEVSNWEIIDNTGQISSFGEQPTGLFKANHSWDEMIQYGLRGLREFPVGVYYYNREHPSCEELIMIPDYAKTAKTFEFSFFIHKDEIQKYRRFEVRRKNN